MSNEIRSKAQSEPEWFTEVKRLHGEFEQWWTSRVKDAPLISDEADRANIDRIKGLCREFFGFGYEQRKQEEATALKGKST